MPSSSALDHPPPSTTTRSPAADGATQYTIGQLAEEFDLTTRAIRFYEDQGLLQPSRSGQKRIYGHRDRIRLRLIQRGKRMGLSLREIHEILDMYDAGRGEAKQLRYFLDRIAQRRQHLELQRRDIDSTLDDLDAIARRCRDRLESL